MSDVSESADAGAMTQPSTLVDDLRAVAARIAQGWTQGACARTADGRVTGPTDPRAVRWDIYGAIRSVHECQGAWFEPGENGGLGTIMNKPSEYVALKAAVMRGIDVVRGPDMPHTDLVRWNDEEDQSHTRVLHALNCAIMIAMENGTL